MPGGKSGAPSADTMYPGKQNRLLNDVTPLFLLNGISTLSLALNLIVGKSYRCRKLCVQIGQKK